MSELTRKEEFWWAVIVLALLYSTASIVFALTSHEEPEPYIAPCRTAGHAEVPCE